MKLYEVKFDVGKMSRMLFDVFNFQKWTNLDILCLNSKGSKETWLSLSLMSE